MKNTSKQAGFSIIELCLIVVAVGLIGFTGWYVFAAKDKAQSTYNNLKQVELSTVKNPVAPTFTESDEGKSKSIAIGKKFDVQLGSTYWTFDALSSENIVKSLGKPTVHSSTQHSVPGSGQGTVTAHFIAVANGMVNITAHRVSCGEALGCGPSESSFSITINVK